MIFRDLDTTWDLSKPSNHKSTQVRYIHRNWNSNLCMNEILSFFSHNSLILLLPKPQCFLNLGSNILEAMLLQRKSFYQWSWRVYFYKLSLCWVIIHKFSNPVFAHEFLTEKVSQLFFWRVSVKADNETQALSMRLKHVGQSRSLYVGLCWLDLTFLKTSALLTRGDKYSATFPRVIVKHIK